MPLPLTNRLPNILGPLSLVKVEKHQRLTERLRPIARGMEALNL